MNQEFMTLKVLMPYKVFIEELNIKRIVVETPQGLWGLWPHRLDCVVDVCPGIFLYENVSNEEKLLAVDEGFLVKTGMNVFLCVRHAIGGASLGRLQARVVEEFLTLDSREKNLRSELSKMEAGLVTRLWKLHHE